MPTSDMPLHPNISFSPALQTRALSAYPLFQDFGIQPVAFQAKPDKLNLA